MFNPSKKSSKKVVKVQVLNKNQQKLVKGGNAEIHTNIGVEDFIIG